MDFLAHRDHCFRGKILGERDQLEDLVLYDRIILKWIFRVTEIIVLMEKTVGKRPLRRPSSIWEDNIKMDLQAQGDNCFGGKTWGKETTYKT